MEAAQVVLPVAGLAAGTVLGFVARRNFFCTLSALEQHWYGNNSNGLRSWVLAAVIAAILTQTMNAAGIADTRSSFYLTASFSWLGAVVGGLAFGFGMALVGTCGYGALVRLGGGSLKSLMAVLVLGITALSTQRGLLGLGRVSISDQFQLDLSAAGDQSIPSLVDAVTSVNLSAVTIVVLLVVPLIWIFRDPAFRTDRRGIVTALVVGCVVAFGWFATSRFAETSFVPVQLESASFVVPLADVILHFAAFTGTGPDYGVGMVFGTVFGSALAARMADNVRWEACDDARELSRHIIGAALMGFGGVLALGCTIGQGISAASLLAVSVPVTMISIGFGARMGLAFLLEGSALAPFRRFG